MGWQVIEAALWGVAIAIGAFWWRSTPATTRFIDLASYLLSFLTLIVGLFAFYNSHDEKLEIIDRMLIKSNIVDIQFDTTVEAWKLCPRVPHSPYRPTIVKRAECDKLNKYVDALKFNPDLVLPELTRLPELNLIIDYSDPDVSALAQRVQQRVIETNKLIDRYGADLKSHWRMEALEEIFKELALPVFAFAFGLGLARRAIDLVRELPQRFRAPFQRIDRIVWRKLRRSRRCTGVLRNRWFGGRRQYLA